MRTVVLGCNANYETLVSDEDYEYVTRWKWNWKQSAKRYKYAIYARRAAGRRTILLSHDILEKRMGKPRPSPKHIASHENGNSLDNTRENLAWRTKRQNAKIREGHRQKKLALVMTSKSPGENCEDKRDVPF